jgi:hypothetical protein
MRTNSSKSNSPLPSSSTSLIISNQTLSSIFFYWQSISFTSPADIDPPLSLSNKSNIYLSFSSVNSFSLFIVATKN